MENNATETTMTIEQACKFIRNSRGRSIFLTVNQHSPIEGEEGKVFPILGHIKVSAPAACTFVKDAYKGFAERGGRVRISTLGTCVFVG